MNRWLSRMTMFFMGAGVFATGWHVFSAFYNPKNNAGAGYLTKEIRDLESLANENTEPRDAFGMVDAFISFSSDSDKINYGQGRWASAEEALLTGSSDCTGGALLFKRLMSKNKNYEIRIKWLSPKSNPGSTKKRTGHIIDIYHDRRTGKFGWVSFNKNRFGKALCDSKEDAVRDYNDQIKNPFEKKVDVNLSDDEIKPGRNINAGKTLSIQKMIE